jgi:hypothetical protein
MTIFAYVSSSAFVLASTSQWLAQEAPWSSGASPHGLCLALRWECRIEQVRVPRESESIRFCEVSALACSAQICPDVATVRNVEWRERSQNLLRVACLDRDRCVRCVTISVRFAPRAVAQERPQTVVELPPGVVVQTWIQIQKTVDKTSSCKLRPPDLAHHPAREAWAGVRKWPMANGSSERSRSCSGAGRGAVVRVERESLGSFRLRRRALQPVLYPQPCGSHEFVDIVGNED